MAVVRAQTPIWSDFDWRAYVMVFYRDYCFLAQLYNAYNSVYFEALVYLRDGAVKHTYCDFFVLRVRFSYFFPRYPSPKRVSIPFS